MAKRASMVDLTKRANYLQKLGVRPEQQREVLKRMKKGGTVKGKNGGHMMPEHHKAMHGKGKH